VETFSPNILILTTRTGGGHMNLARAIKEELPAHYKISIEDPYPSILHDYYAILSRYFLTAWDIQYKVFDSPKGALLFHRAMTFLIKQRVIDVIDKIKPDLIISTHSLLSYEVVKANEQRQQEIPLVFQLTDLEEVHTTWFTDKHAAAYLAPSREIYAQALRNGIDEERVYATGRPIRKQFLQTSSFNRAETLSVLGLDPDIFTVFLQGGAKGSAGVERTVKSILTADVPMQIILAVGNNPVLAAHFSNMEHLHVLPFTEAIAPYMAASDLIAGKAGASFLSEAFMLEKPFLVTTFIPGQEGPSLRFLERHNLGWVRLNAASQKQLLTDVACNPVMMAEKITCIRAYKAWNMQANETFAPIIEKVLKANSPLLQGEGLQEPAD
jgi:UDP-N-acetylglucosamine:LPS N-acetylglucosamine transferase